VYAASDSYPVCILVKDTSFDPNIIETTYVEPLEAHGISREDMIIIPLDYLEGKAPKKHIDSVLSEILESLESLGTRFIYCADSAFFKALAKVKKAEQHLGYEMPCLFRKESEHLKIIYGINDRSIIYNPDANTAKLSQSIDALVASYFGNPAAFDQIFLNDVSYPTSNAAIERALHSLHQHPEISCDIETASLEHNKAGIATIAFSWNHTDGIAFAVDYSPLHQISLLRGEMIVNRSVRSLLKQFFKDYTGRIRYHNCSYDTKVLIYELMMEADGLNMKGMIDGLHLFHKNIDDTKMIAYLALNSVANTELSLKALSQSYAGNYAVDVSNVLTLSLPDLLQYNLIDACCTNWVYDKYYPIMVQDKQLELYHSFMMPSQKTITQLELTGMPVNPVRVQEVKAILLEIQEEHEAIIMDSYCVLQAEAILRKRSYDKDYEDRKDKSKNPDKIMVRSWDDWPEHVFNANSSLQLQVLLYEVMGLPVIDKTKSGQPSTGTDVITNLMNHTDDAAWLRCLEAISTYSGVDKILTTFIPAFENAIDKGENVYWIHGSFNLGGTLSGRLSSSNPNLQQIPSGSTYGKLIKSCFQAPEGYLFAGADFNSLEDMISALTTKDPQKMKVYEDGYDGHSLRAYSYFGDEMPDIENTVESINSIKQKYSKIREASKPPTFALTYGGTFRTLMKNCGFGENQAKGIEAEYHDLYQVSDQWVQDKIDQAYTDGYVTVAFGLRVRTPLLVQSVHGSKLAFEAESEGRSAGNALGQSFGMLNCRAFNEFMERVWNSPYKYLIKPCALIHDAIYLVFKNNIKIVDWVNRNLIECMQWQELPEIQHPDVKLGAELDLHYKSWDQPVTIPNNATQPEIRATCVAKKTEYEQ